MNRSRTRLLVALASAGALLATVEAAAPPT